MKIVFDFGAVLFRWHPPSFLARVWGHRAADEIEGAALASMRAGGAWDAAMVFFDAIDTAKMCLAVFAPMIMPDSTIV